MKEKIFIEGGKKLTGSISISGAKNSCLTLMPASILTDEKLTQEELEQEDNVLVECILTDKSDLVGKSLKSGNFRRRFGAFILAVRREGVIFRKKIAHVVLNAYDTLLVYGPAKKIVNFSKGNLSTLNSFSGAEVSS